MGRKLLVLLVLAATAVILTYWMLSGQFNWSLFFSTLRTMNGWWLAAGVVATLLTYVIRAYRWQVLLAPLKSIRIEPLLSTTLVGFSAIYIFGRWGELARPIWLTRREQIPLSASFATIVVERFLDTLMLIALFAWALVAVEVAPGAGQALALMKEGGWLMAAGSVVAIVSLFAFRSNLNRILPWIPVERVRSMIQSFAEGLNFLQSGRSLALALFHSVVLWVAIALQFWFTLIGLNFDLSIEASTLVLVGTALGSIIQVPGIGGGFQAGFVFCLGTFFDVPTERALAASFVAWAFSYAPTVLVTGIYMAVQGLGLRDVKSMIEEPQSKTV